MDLSTSQMCSIRFMGCRANEEALPPRLAFVPGDKALDWKALLVATGYEPAPLPEDPKAPIVIVTPSGEVREYKINSDWDQLKSDIQERMPISKFIRTQLGIESEKESGHYKCMLHAGEGDRTFHIFRGTDGVELWKCHSQCGAGDVIKLASKAWNLSWKDALFQLATQVGLDPNSYRSDMSVSSSADPFEPPREEDQRLSFKLKVKLKGETHEIPAQAPAFGHPPGDSSDLSTELVRPPSGPAEVPLTGKVKPPPKPLRKKGRKKVSKWASKWVYKAKNHVKSFALSAGKMILMAMAQDNDGKADPREVAALLWPAVGGYYRKFHALEADLADLINRIKNGKRCRGYTWLKKCAGSRCLFDLQVALRRDGYGRFASNLKSVMGLGLLRGDEADLAAGMPRFYRRSRPTSQDGSESYERQVTMLINGLQRPANCGVYKQILTEDGRNLGPPSPDGSPSVLSRRMVCEAKLCPYCMHLELLAEAAELEQLWGHRQRNRKRGDDGFFMVEMTGIPDMHRISEIKNYVSRQPDPKLPVLGWGADGLPMLRYFVMTMEARDIVASQLEAAGSLIFDLDLPVKRIRLSGGYKEAVDLALETKLSYYVHGQVLLETGSRQRLVDWLWWSSRKSPVRNPRNEFALSWPTKPQLKLAVKEARGENYELDVLDQDNVTYTVLHDQTGYKLGSRKRIPYTINQVIELAEHSLGLRHAKAKFAARGQGGLAAHA
jgi:hypothetical protein